MNPAEVNQVLETGNPQLSQGWRVLLAILVVAGVVVFFVGSANGDSSRVWIAFLINMLFWGGLAQGGIVLSAIWQVTDAKWGRPFKRLAECLAAFLPFSFLSFIILCFGLSELYEWTEHPIESKSLLLDVAFFISRNLVRIVIVYLLAFIYLWNALKPDLRLAQHHLPQWGGKLAARILGRDAESDPQTTAIRCEKRARRLAPWLLFAYAFLISYVAFDLVMTLDQEWFSTLFGVFFLVGNLYTTLALLLVLAAWIRRKSLLNEYITINRFHDLGKLTFAMAMLWAYLIFSQYIVIWYSNLPEETPYLIERSLPGTPWFYLFWTLFGVLFLLPFLGLMPRTICRRPRLVIPLAVLLLVGQWWAHYLMVVPAIQATKGHGHWHVFFGAYEIFLTLGFGALFFASFFWLIGKVPVLPIADKHLCKSWHGR